MNKKDRAKGDKWGSGEDVSQAVVIADSFNFRFLPITAEKPRALLPLVNRPLIDYTVEFLAVSGVEEIFVYCCAHSDQLKEHLARSRWNKPGSPVRLHTIIAEDCPSVGDALRDIDSQSLIRSDFVLVSGDLVSNMELREVINKHKRLKQTDKMTVMTTVYKKAAPGHRTRSVEDDILIATDSSNDRLLFCEKPGRKKKLALPVEIFKECGEVDIHYDVLDCHISVCSPNVPQLFSDNFDYQSRYHFIRGIIVNEEVLGNHMYAHFISDQYAARVSNLQTYDSISCDVIHRWVYPLVPDNTQLTDSYSYGRRNIYLASHVQLAFSCELKEDVVIGPSSSVGAGTTITHSSIGCNCTIGKNVNIVGCYIWDNVVIGDGCVINKSILSDNVELKAGVTVEPGSIVSFNVVIGTNFIVKSGSRLTTSIHSTLPTGDGWEDEGSESVSHSKPVDSVEEVGEGGRGFRWEPPAVNSDDEYENVVVEKWHQDTSIEEEEDEQSSGMEVSPGATPEPSARLANEGENVFYYEVLDSVRSGVVEGVTNENTILMINSSKHAYNVPIQDVPLAVVRAILEGPADGNTAEKPPLLPYIQKAFTHYQTLLLHYIKDSTLQISVLHCLADCALMSNSIMAILPKIVLLLYNIDVVEESAIMDWSEEIRQGEQTPQHKEIAEKMSPVIEWLQNAEEESDESDQ